MFYDESKPVNAFFRPQGYTWEGVNRNFIFKKSSQGTFNGFSVELQSEVSHNLELMMFCDQLVFYSFV